MKLERKNPREPLENTPAETCVEIQGKTIERSYRKFLEESTGESSGKERIAAENE